MSADWSLRLAQNRELKQAMAERCIDAHFISRYDHVFLDCGTTFVFLAEMILEHSRLLRPVSVTTTNVEILQRCVISDTRDIIDLCMLGGHYVPQHHSFDGTLSNIGLNTTGSSARFDTVFIGACPLDPQLRIMAEITDFVTVKKHVLSHARKVIVVTDTSKFRPAGHGEQPVARLESNEEGQLAVKLADAPSLAIPAVIVMGMVQEPEYSGRNQEFSSRCSRFGFSKHGDTLIVGNHRGSDDSL